MIFNLQLRGDYMETNYQKLYAYLVGQIDDTLQFIAGELVGGGCDNSALVMVGNRLKDALLTAEDMYLDDSEDE